MKVFKFGGASVNTVDRIKNVAGILRSIGEEKILIVISAIGKTTNALESVAEAFYAGKKEEALQLFDQVKRSHVNTLDELLVINHKKAIEELSVFFTEIEWLLHDKPVRDYDYYYDQIVCIGELLSTSLISSYLKEVNIKNTWIDVRDIFRTDDNFRDANIDLAITGKKIDEIILPLFSKENFMITQGFIGATDENESTTLGREGSDYTAALFANLLDAESLTIWKDVEGIMNADPKEFADAKFLKQLSYNEVIEMAYYGAQVIHPKTIKPLQNKNIPLYVSCFLNPQSQGTVITKKNVSALPPIIVIKKEQVLMRFNSKDFSFVGEKPVSVLYEIFAKQNTRPNLTQNGAISLLCCMDDVPDKIEKLALSASDIFDVQLEKDLTLLTIRHYTKDIIDELIDKNKVVLEQKTNETIQVLMKK
ncbi:MAG: aspartate kinase [Chitinophagaceae bacterium]|nr:aspartate kinase [Chitinophagaceae bacterium]